MVQEPQSHEEGGEMSPSPTEQGNIGQGGGTPGGALECRCLSQGDLGLWEAGVPSMGGDGNEPGWWQPSNLQMLCLAAAAAAAAAAAKSLQSCPTVRPHRQQPTRLPHPWDFPGKNTGVGCHFLLQSMKVKRESEVAQSFLTLRDPMDCSLPGSSVHGIFQARVLEWGAIAFSDISHRN